MTATDTVPIIKRWDTHPDRESLQVIYRFLSQYKRAENVSLEPRRTHPRLVRAAIDRQGSPTAYSILKTRWYETGDFVITCQVNQKDAAFSTLQWTHLPDTEEIKLSQNGSDDAETLTPPSHHPARDRFHPLQVLPLVLATMKEHTESTNLRPE